MQTSPFGDTGIQLSRLCLGTMMFGPKTSRDDSVAIMHRALEAGIGFWDCAAMYGDGLSERIVGEAMAGRRDRVFLATKVHKGLTRDDIVSSCEESLQRLDTDYIDLFQIHWPAEGMNLIEIARAFDELIRAGKVRFAGCCNYGAYLMALSRQSAEREGLATLGSNQIPYNPIERGAEIELLPYCASENIPVMVYRPVSMGLLTGKYRQGRPAPEGSRGQTDERIANWLARYGEAIERFVARAKQKGVAPAALASAWLLVNRAPIFPIVGVSRMEQLEEALTATEIAMDEAERAEIAGWFDAAPWEEAGGNFPPLRRTFGLIER